MFNCLFQLGQNLVKSACFFYFTKAFPYKLMVTSMWGQRVHFCTNSIPYFVQNITHYPVVFNVLTLHKSFNINTPLNEAFRSVRAILTNKKKTRQYLKSSHSHKQSVQSLKSLAIFGICLLATKQNNYLLKTAFISLN